MSKIKSLVNRFIYHPYMGKFETYALGAIDASVLTGYKTLDGNIDKIVITGIGILAHYVGCSIGRKKQAREERKNLESLTEDE
ncbi:hypothetical protein KY348_04445 [Candidatus Woesearchaeota archaeon]|nr:hypothetical protein [Candidatus Woesearchaeota archaeon]